MADENVPSERFVGVVFLPHKKKYRAQIYRNSQMEILKYCDTEEEAARTFDVACGGPSVNFPEEAEDLAELMKADEASVASTNSAIMPKVKITAPPAPEVENESNARVNNDEEEEEEEEEKKKEKGEGEEEGGGEEEEEEGEEEEDGEGG